MSPPQARNQSRRCDGPKTGLDVAVATLEGVLVNQHLGEACQFAVFTRESGAFASLKPVRPRLRAADSNDGTLWPILHDCRAGVGGHAGESPKSALASKGIRVVMMEGLIEEGLDAVYRNAEIRAPLRKQHRCGSGSGGEKR